MTARSFKPCQVWVAVLWFKTAAVLQWHDSDSGHMCNNSFAHACILWVLQDMAGRVAAVVDGGPCACGVESTVLDGLRCPPVVLRPGGVTPELLGVCPDMQGLQVREQQHEHYIHLL